MMMMMMMMVMVIAILFFVGIDTSTHILVDSFEVPEVVNEPVLVLLPFSKLT